MPVKYKGYEIFYSDDPSSNDIVIRIVNKKLEQVAMLSVTKDYKVGDLSGLIAMDTFKDLLKIILRELPE